MTGRHAGSSADEVARRHREKIVRLERSAANWEAGAAGERAVGEILDQLTSSGWTVLHDVPWPGRSRANIDHVAVGPGGVFVIDAKNWSGRIEVRDGLLLQNGRSRKRELQGVAGAVVAVMQFNPRVTTYGVLCLVGEEPRRDLARDLTVCSSASLLDVVRSAPVVLTPEQVVEVSRELEKKLTRSLPVFEGVSRRRGQAAPRSRRRSSLLRPVVGLAIGATMFVGLVTDGFSKVPDAVSGFVSDVAGDGDTSSPPAPEKKTKQPRKKRAGQ